MPKIIITGGTGFLGDCLAKYYASTGAAVTILTRGKSRTDKDIRYIHWDARTLAVWANELEGADVLINLNGKSVDCRYTKKNKALIYSSRLEATRILGQAILLCKNPPRLWINASSATIYRHSLDKEMDEYRGEAGSGFSVDVCQQWEHAFNDIKCPNTRKVILRTAIVLGRRGGALKPLLALARIGIGGKQGQGNQYVSWLHEDDFVQMVEFIVNHPSMSGVYNLASPNPIPNRDFMKALRQATNKAIGIPMPVWLLKLGAVFIGTETELVLKSRRVVPAKMLEAGYQFRFPAIDQALNNLLTKHPTQPIPHSSFVICNS